LTRGKPRHRDFTRLLEISNLDHRDKLARRRSHVSELSRKTDLIGFEPYLHRMHQPIRRQIKDVHLTRTLVERKPKPALARDAHGAPPRPRFYRTDQREACRIYRHDRAVGLIRDVHRLAQRRVSDRYWPSANLDR